MNYIVVALERAGMDDYVEMVKSSVPADLNVEKMPFTVWCITYYSISSLYKAKSWNELKKSGYSIEETSPSIVVGQKFNSPPEIFRRMYCLNDGKYIRTIAGFWRCAEKTDIAILTSGKLKEFTEPMLKGG